MHDDRQDRRHTRADYDTDEEWVRYLHESGLEPDGNEAAAGSGWSPIGGSGHYASLYRAIRGHTQRQHARAWGEWGVTTYVRNRDFMKVYDAIKFANCRGLVINASVHVSWSTVAITGDEAVAGANKRFLELLRKWLHERDLPKAWFWVLERGSTHGLHSHIAVHVPYIYKGLFENWSLKAVRTISGKAPVRDRRRGIFTIKVGHPPERAWRVQWRYFRYVMKGMAPQTRVRNSETPLAPPLLKEVAGLTLKPQGNIRTKRVGVSREIDRAAQTGMTADTPPCPFRHGATTPREIYTDAYLRWYEDRSQKRQIQLLVDTFA